MSTPRALALGTGIALAACAPRETSGAATARPETQAPDGGARTGSDSDAGASSAVDPLTSCVARMTERCASVAPKKASCPPTLEARWHGTACGWMGVTATTTCTYGDTTCVCAASPYCGGPEPSEAMVSTMRWSCREVLRPDACPRDDAETQRGTCSTSGKRCSITTCGARTDCTCDGRGWKCSTTALQLPP